MQLETEATGLSQSQPYDVERIAAKLELNGASFVAMCDMKAVWELSVARLGSGVASLEMMQRVTAIAPNSTIGVWEEDRLSAAVAGIPLRKVGVDALEAGLFDPIDVNLDFVARPSERAAGFYGWGVASVSKDATRKLIMASLALQEDPDVRGTPTYAHAVTDQGRALLARLGYRQLEPLAREIYVLDAEAKQAMLGQAQ
jgi:hypothetical protein